MDKGLLSLYPWKDIFFIALQQKKSIILINTAQSISELAPFARNNPPNQKSERLITRYIYQAAIDTAKYQGRYPLYFSSYSTSCINMSMVRKSAQFIA